MSFGGFFVLKIVVLFLMRGWSHIFTLYDELEVMIKIVRPDRPVQKFFSLPLLNLVCLLYLQVF
jgi:hypothetical protein